MTTVSGRVMHAGFPPGQPDAYVTLGVEGDLVSGNTYMVTRYVNSGTEATADGEPVEGFGLASWLTHNKCDVVLTVDENNYNAVCRAAFTKVGAP